MSDSPNERIQRAFREQTGLLQAMRESVQDAAKQYVAAGELMAVSKNGRVVWVDPVTFQPVEFDGTQTEAQAATPAD